MGWKVRAVRLEDAKAVIDILNPIILNRSSTALDTPFSLEEEEDYIRDFPASGIFHVAVSPTGKVSGLQTVERFADYSRAFDHVGVMGTYVDSSCRRQGVATMLFRETFNAARKKGFVKIFTFVRSDNSAGLATYLKQDFEQIGVARKQVKIDGKYIDEIMIEKFL